MVLAEVALPVPALQPVNYSSSVDIRPEWSVVEQIPFSSLTKLNFTVAKPEEVTFCTHHAAACACPVAPGWRGTGEPLAPETPGAACCAVPVDLRAPSGLDRLPAATTLKYLACTPASCLKAPSAQATLSHT